MKSQRLQKLSRLRLVDLRVSKTSPQEEKIMSSFNRISLLALTSICLASCGSSSGGSGGDKNKNLRASLKIKLPKELNSKTDKS